MPAQRLRQSLGVLLVWLGSVVPAIAAGLLVDPHFQRGVVVEPTARIGQPGQTAPRARKTCLPHPDCSTQPAWFIQQWANAGNIAVAEQKRDGEYVLLDAGGVLQKRLHLSPHGEAGDVTLEMNGFSEFRARQADGTAAYLPDLRHPWPHWLLSQPIESGRLSQYSQLSLQGQLRLVMDDLRREPGYDPSVHAARLVLAMTVRNRLSGDYFWLTLPLYDDRFTRSGLGCQKCRDGGEQCFTPARLSEPGTWRCPEDRVGDRWWKNAKPGTARMIFRMPDAAFLQGDVRSGQWVVVNGDFLPYIKAGIEAAQQRSGSRHFPQDLFFYELGLFSLGWEITGFNHVSVQLRDWQVYAERKP